MKSTDVTSPEVIPNIKLFKKKILFICIILKSFVV